MCGLRKKYISMDICRTFLIAASISIGLHGLGLAQEADQQVSRDVSSAAATVDDVAISVAEVDLRVQRALGQRTATEQVRALLQAEALEQLIKQQKVLVQLQRRGEACTEKELEVEIRRLEEELNRQEKTLRLLEKKLLKMV